MKGIVFKLFGIIIAGMISNSALAQTDPVLLRVDGEPVTKSEFLRVYQKNNVSGSVIDKKSLEEYLELYINFKLKVKEAEKEGLDTAKTFINELAGYRKQLAQPYLTDKTVTGDLIKEAYNRMKFDVRAAHILIKLPENALPADTLKKYNEIMAIRERIMKGEDFGKVASEVSEDLSARDKPAQGNRPAVKGNRGELGYFTVFDLVYPFETAAYTTKVGEISMPVRTSFGYHLIKVSDKKPAMGRVQVAHILFAFKKDTVAIDSAAIAQKAMEVYQKVLAGDTFENLAKEYSDDKGSADNGGVLPWFGSFRMVPEFVVAVSNIKEKGAISKPIKTRYGWHIIKLVDRKDIRSFEELEGEIKLRVSRDTRAQKSKKAIINKIKKEYKYSVVMTELEDYYTLVTKAIFQGKWNADTAAELNALLFTLADKKFYQSDFTAYLNKTQTIRNEEEIPLFVHEMFNRFVDEKCIEYEDSRLEIKYPEFKALMKEYRDGILLFELTDQKVWSKAVKDTTGLKAFHEQNKSKYMWKNRLDCSVYRCANESIAKQAKKLAKKASKKGYSNEDIMGMINKESQLNLQIERNKYTRGENPLVDNIEWTEGISANSFDNGKVVFVVVHKYLPARSKKLNEARGIITADYQNYLEKAWVEELREKYKVVVDQEVFDSIK